MEVVGRLAGGVAHDFNNLLTVINGCAELALTDLGESDPARADLLQIRDSGRRAAALTRQLLAFSRKQIARRETIDLGQLIADFHGILQRLIGEDVALQIVRQPGTTCVLGDPSQLEQVILNLAVNSRDAMPAGGSLWLEVSRVELDDDFAAAHVGAQAGPHVKLAVRDTGSGMSPEVLSRVFEPFFTTKDAGKGTGLGLATTYAIVEQSGGTIWVTTEIGVGTTFQIYLPRVEPSELVQGDATAPIPGGGETVLLVEDEEAVRNLSARVLEAAGYKVVTASDASEAMAAIESPGTVIDIVVTDVVLRGEGGRELVERAIKARPRLAVLFTSGYTSDVVLAHGVRDNTTAFIGKPYTPRALSNRIREVLTQHAQHPAS
jgi:CheY-like chemotaxis protein